MAYDKTDYTSIMKLYRTRHGLSQKDMAQRLGVSQQLYSLYENGRSPKIGFIKRFKQVTGVDLTENMAQVFFSDDKYLNGMADSLSATVNENTILRKELDRKQDEIIELKKRIRYLEDKLIGVGKL